MWSRRVVLAGLAAAGAAALFVARRHVVCSSGRALSAAPRATPALPAPKLHLHVFAAANAAAALSGEVLAAATAAVDAHRVIVQRLSAQAFADRVWLEHSVAVVVVVDDVLPADAVAVLQAFARAGGAVLITGRGETCSNASDVGPGVAWLSLRAGVSTSELRDALSRLGVAVGSSGTAGDSTAIADAPYFLGSLLWDAAIAGSVWRAATRALSAAPVCVHDDWTSAALSPSCVVFRRNVLAGDGRGSSEPVAPSLVIALGRDGAAVDVADALAAVSSHACDFDWRAYTAALESVNVGRIVLHFNSVDSTHTVLDAHFPLSQCLNACGDGVVVVANRCGGAASTTLPCYCSCVVWEGVVGGGWACGSVVLFAFLACSNLLTMRRTAPPSHAGKCVVAVAAAMRGSLPRAAWR
jgi:hypothetical protein